MGGGTFMGTYEGTMTSTPEPAEPVPRGKNVVDEFMKATSNF